MYFPINIDLTNLIEEFDLDGEQIENLGSQLIDQISHTFFNALRTEVNQRLKGAREVYLKGLSMRKIDPLTSEIVLEGWLPNALEEGIDEFDMKEGFSKSDKIKISKYGNWYLTIPFKHSTPGSSGETGKPLPKEIHNIVKKQSTPLKKVQIPESYRVQQIKELANGKTYQHKSSIYEGVRKEDSERKNSGYISFRRAGAKSDPNVFIHPGFEARNFFGKALDNIDRDIPVIADEIIDRFLRDLG